MSRSFPYQGLAFAVVVALHVALHRVCIRTLEEPVVIGARCRLGFERRVDAAISRTVLEDQNAHAVIGTRCRRNG
jgi:hypothetical protein